MNKYDTEPTCPPTPATEVGMALDQTEKAILSIRETITILGNRLSPALRPSSPQPCGECADESPRPSTCVLTDRLENFQRELQGIHNGVEELHNRLAI
jgi:hypothetical protein